MKHTYTISGMTCNGCRSHVEHTLKNVKGVTDASVNLEKAEAEIEMKSHIKLGTFQKALEEDGGAYQIEKQGKALAPKKKKPIKADSNKEGTGTFYCPMHCEGGKTYDNSGDCPVCGMDLVEEMSLKASGTKYTCPMHPEIIKDEPGSCPICGMDLVPMKADI